ncbi:hypothetical protein XANCAGTX0491_008808 [Xanthoria calcicola]
MSITVKLPGDRVYIRKSVKGMISVASLVGFSPPRIIKPAVSSIATDDISRMDSLLITLARMLQLLRWTTFDPVGQMIQMATFNWSQLDFDSVRRVVADIAAVNVDADRLNVVMDLDSRVLVDCLPQDGLDTMLGK